MRALALALGFSLFGGTALAGQSLFSSYGLGLPVDAIDGRARALGNLGLGLSGAALLPTDPAAAARLRLPTGVLVAQPSWADASDGVETNYYRGTRFPLLAAAYPVLGGIASVHFSSLLDQDFEGNRVSDVVLGGVTVPATDSFVQDGSVSTMNVGFARMITEQTSVGLTVGRYTGRIRRAFQREITTGPDETAVQPYISTGEWSYKGYLVTGGVATRLLEIVNLSASATWSTNLDATASETTAGGDGSFNMPVQLRVGASAALAPGLTLNASAARADWSGVQDNLTGGAEARATTAFGVGLELAQARLLGRQAPLRLGFRRAGLPFAITSVSSSERVFSGGFGLTLNQTGEFVLADMDFGLERGRRSTGQLTENFWRATLSLKLSGL